MKTCPGTTENPRFVLGKAYCPECHRPVRFKLYNEDLSFTIMVTRHYPGGGLINPGPRDGYHQFREVV